MSNNIINNINIINDIIKKDNWLSKSNYILNDDNIIKILNHNLYMYIQSKFNQYYLLTIINTLDLNDIKIYFFTELNFKNVNRYINFKNNIDIYYLGSSKYKHIKKNNTFYKNLSGNNI